tara:strand:- start:28705 stop:35109 length:6405 start_codon:yes stop_codon:yes gene_type:complete
MAISSDEERDSIRELINESRRDSIRELINESRLNFISTLPIGNKIELPTPNFDGATHFCQSAVKYFSSFIPESIASGELISGEHLKAIELDLGEGFGFGLFENQAGERFFLKESSITSLGTGLLRLKPFKKLDRVSFDRFRDLKSAGFNMPFFLNDDYSVKFDTGMKNKEEIMSRIEDFKLLGIKEICDYYGKAVSDPDILNLRDTFGFIDQGQIFTPTRKGASHELILSIKSRYLDSLPDRNIQYFENFYKNILSTNFKSRDFSNIVSNLSKILKKNHDSISKFKGIVNGIDLGKLSEKNFKFFNEVKYLLKENGYVLENLSMDSKMEFGFDPTTLDLAYIMMFDGINPGKFMNTGINKLSLMTDPKISKLMLNAKNILNSENSGIPWQEFLSSYFGGDYSILFGKIKENLGLNIPISKLEDAFETHKSQFENPFKDSKGALDLSKLVESGEFKDITSQILEKARNQIGDNFLLNLSEIVANIDDLESLYQLVFDKISVEDLSSLLLEKASEELGISDINEIIARAVFKKMQYERMIDMIFENFTEENIKALLGDICLNYDFGFEEIEAILESYETNLYSFILHYDNDGQLDGMLTQAITSQGKDFVKEKLDNLGYTDCISLFLNIKYRDVFEQNSAREIICKLLQGNIPTFSNPCTELAADIRQLLSNPPNFQSLKLDIKTSLKKLNPSPLRASIDLGIKRLFREDSNFFQKLIQIPKFRFEFDKQSKTRGKLFKRDSGVGIDVELRKSEKGFSLPSLGSVNPKFDFTKFQIGGIDDIFSDVIDGIEDSIMSGIETSLISSFKLLLSNLLQSLRGGLDLSVPDFGGERIGELFDASNGMGFNLALEGLLPKFKGKLDSLRSELERRGQSGFSVNDFGNFGFLPRRGMTGIGTDLENLGIKIGVLDPISIGDLSALDLPSLGNLGINPLDMPSLDDLSISKKDIMDFFDQISDGLKPKEVFEFMRGNMDDFEFSKISTLVKDPKMKLILDDELLKSISESCSELVDLDLIDEIEAIYDGRDSVGALCENLGLNYGQSPYPDVKTLGEELADNYEGISEEDIVAIMGNLLESIKDNVSDALGKAGNVDLPFTSNPDSFMPSPSEIPAMDFANDVVLDAIFDPIKKEYKREAASYSDNLLTPSESEDYVKMYLQYGDGIITGYADGILDISTILEDYRYNPEFEAYFKTRNAKLYFKAEGGTFVEYGLTSDNPRPEIGLVTNDSQAEFAENLYFCSNPDKANIYIKKDSTELKPPTPDLNELPKFSINSDGTLEVSLRELTLQYMTSQTTLTNNEQGCSEPVTSTSEPLNNPVESFKENVYSNLGEIYRGVEYRNEIADQMDQVFLEMNQYIAEKLLLTYKNASRFSSTNAQELYSLVVDSDAIDLLDIESIKNISKDDYNNNFSFNQIDENQMSISAAQGLVYANFKIYAIELLLRGYYTLDVFFDKSGIMPTQFPQRVMMAFKEDFVNYPDYISKIEKITPLPSFEFNMIMKQIYLEISSKLSLIFEDAKNDYFALTSIMNNSFIHVFEPSPSGFSQQELAEFFINSYSDGIRLVSLPYYVDLDGTELTERTQFQTTEDGYSTQPARRRICFLSQFSDFAAEDIDDRFVGIGNIVRDDEVPNHKTYMTSGSISQTFLFPATDDGSVLKKNTLNVIPILDIEHTTTTRPMINEFISEYSIFSDINDLLIAAISNDIANQSPQVLTAFTSTKEAIRNTFQSLKNSEKTFDNDDKELELKISQYFEESGTNPDYSNIARKMALQTVPLILKGMAEQFDTNTQIASKVRMGADIAGVNIPPQIASLIVFGASGWTLPPNPVGLMYLASGYLEPKERKRIKEMDNGRNTKRGVAVDDADDILEQLENFSETSRQVLKEAELDTYTSAITMFLNDYSTLEDIYFEGGYYEDTNDFPKPKDGSNRDDTFSVAGLTFLMGKQFNLQGYANLSGKLKATVERIEDIVNVYVDLNEELLLDEEFTDKAIEKELFEQDDFQELRKYLQNSLKATYWISEGLNMIAAMHRNINWSQSEAELTYAQEMSIDVATIYSVRATTAQDIYSAYQDVRDDKSYDYNDVIGVSGQKTRQKLAKWTVTYTGLEAAHEPYGTSEDKWTYANTWLPMIDYLITIVIPYLEDNGY